uniref:One cut domain family member n=1 Tax=Parastrongyloides trichosuri TaxID=131310 RepID=A0A0N4ZQM8_PARTI
MHHQNFYQSPSEFISSTPNFVPENELLSEDPRSNSRDSGISLSPTINIPGSIIKYEMIQEHDNSPYYHQYNSFQSMPQRYENSMNIYKNKQYIDGNRMSFMRNHSISLPSQPRMQSTSNFYNKRVINNINYNVYLQRKAAYNVQQERMICESNFFNTNGRYQNAIPQSLNYVRQQNAHNSNLCFMNQRVATSNFNFQHCYNMKQNYNHQRSQHYFPQRNVLEVQESPICGVEQSVNFLEPNLLNSIISMDDSPNFEFNDEISSTLGSQEDTPHLPSLMELYEDELYERNEEKRNKKCKEVEEEPKPKKRKYVKKKKDKCDIDKVSNDVTSISTNAISPLINNEDLKNEALPEDSHEEKNIFFENNKGSILASLIKEKEQVSDNNDVSLATTTLDESSFTINTHELCNFVADEIKKCSVSQSLFAKRVLNRSQGTLSDILRNPKPWDKLKTGKNTFKRMYEWSLLPEKERRIILTSDKDIIFQCREDDDKDIGRKRKKAPRIIYTKEQKEYLNKKFIENRKPCKQGLQEIAETVNLPYRCVSNFFMNTRRKCDKEEEIICNSFGEIQPTLINNDI